MDLKTVFKLRKTFEQEKFFLDMMKRVSTVSTPEFYERLFGEREKQLEVLREEIAAKAQELGQEIIRRVKNSKVQQVMMYRYVDALKFSEIAERMNYSAARIYDWHRQGRDEFCGVV